MTIHKLIDSKLYADNGDGSYSEVKQNTFGLKELEISKHHMDALDASCYLGAKWCDLQSATLTCECKKSEKLKVDLPSKEFITDHIYTLLSSYNQDLSEFEVSVMHYRNPTCNYLELNVFLNNHAYQTKHHISMSIFDNSDFEEIKIMIKENLNALVTTCLDEIKTKTKINMKKENDIMAQYTYGKFEVIKSQEEIELEEKLAKLKAEYDKKVAKLRDEYKAAKEKKARDAKAKELHDKYQSLIDAGFSSEQAYDILQTKMKLDEL